MREGGSVVEDIWASMSKSRTKTLHVHATLDVILIPHETVDDLRNASTGNEANNVQKTKLNSKKPDQEGRAEINHTFCTRTREGMCVQDY